LNGAVGVVMAHPELLAGLRSSIPVRLWEYTGGEEQIENEDSVSYEADISPLYERFRCFYWRLLARASEEPLTVTALPLAESLKVRVISKGPPLIYTALKPLQRFMWRTLKQHPCFSLIGETISERYIQDRMGSKLEDGEIYLSGDYKAATDNLAPWVSNAIVECISDEIGLSEVERYLFKRSLTGHRFDISDMSVSDEVRARAHPSDGHVPQVWGQLMGSITSFPVLCLANAAMCRFALEESTGRKWTLADARLAINGDDVVMRGPRILRDTWRACTSFVGLTESVGKTYFSRSFLEMNSTCFRRLADPFDQMVNGVTRPCYFRQMARINMGLIVGLTRASSIGIGTAVGGSGFTPSIGARCRALVAEAPAKYRDVLIHEFIMSNYQVLSKCRVPWFLPEWIGGLGLPVQTDQRVAPVSKVNYGKAKYLMVTGLVHGLTRPAAASSWETHKLVMARLPMRLRDAIARGSVDDGGVALYGAMCVSLLFDQNVVIADMFDADPNPDKPIEQLKHNEKMWLRADVLGDVDEDVFWKNKVLPVVDTFVSVTSDRVVGPYSDFQP